MSEYIDSAETSVFVISDQINLTSSINKNYFLPGDKIEISGKAVNADGTLYNGPATVVIDTKEYSINIKGKFIFNTNLDTTIKSGEHIVSVNIYDSYGNQANEDKTINVQPVPTMIEILLNNESYLPGDTLSAEIQLYDQANDAMNESISVTLYNPWGVDALSKSVKGDIFNYNFPETSNPFT
jgi:hypothetical protein